MASIHWKRFVVLLVVCACALALVAGVAYAVTDSGNAASPGRQCQGCEEADCQGQGGPGSAMHEYRDDIQDVVAEKLGLSTEELSSGLKGGKTLAELAEEKGVSTEDLAEAVTSKVNEIVDSLVADGEMTAEKAERIKSHVQDHALEQIENGHGKMRKGGGHCGGNPMGE